jgi:deoxyribonuclease V
MLRHSWNLTIRQAMALQRRLAPRVLQAPLDGPVRRIAGADCAFVGGGKAVVASAVLCDARTLEVSATAWAVEPCRFPYVPGLLSFREAPAVIAALRKLDQPIHLLMCDGQGRSHPRRLGLASHVGLYLGLPTIGVAKSRLCGEHGTPGRRRGSRRALLDGQEVIGCVLRTRTGVKPLYISVGHRVNLEDAVNWTLRCTRGFRLCEPSRQAHLLVTALAKRLGQGL